MHSAVIILLLHSRLCHRSHQHILGLLQWCAVHCLLQWLYVPYNGLLKSRSHYTTLYNLVRIACSTRPHGDDIRKLPRNDLITYMNPSKPGDFMATWVQPSSSTFWKNCDGIKFPYYRCRFRRVIRKCSVSIAPRATRAHTAQTCHRFPVEMCLWLKTLECAQGCYRCILSASPKVRQTKSTEKPLVIFK